MKTSYVKCHLQAKFLCQKAEHGIKNLLLPNELNMNEKVCKFSGEHLLSNGCPLLVILF